MRQNNYPSNSHLLQARHPVKRKLPFWTPVSEFDNEDLVYRGEIPSIVGKQIVVVKINHIESLMYCDRAQIGTLRLKYKDDFKHVAGIALEDPKLPPLPRRPNFDIHGEEIDYIAMWADFGLEINLEEESDLLNKRRRKTPESTQTEQLYSRSDYERSDEEEEESEVPNTEAYDRIMKGLNTLLPGEMELFRLLEKGMRDTVISTTLSIKLESVRVGKGRIYKKLRDYYGATSSRQFCQIVVRLYETCRKANLPVPSDHYSSTVKSRGMYAHKKSDKLSPEITAAKKSSPFGSEDFAQKRPEIIPENFGPLEKSHLHSVERENVLEITDLAKAGGPEVNRVLAEWDNAPEAELEDLPAVSFNQFIEAYGNRKDAVKALNQFNKLNILEKQRAFEFIPQFKESLEGVTFQQSPYLYLAGRSWQS